MNTALQEYYAQHSIQQTHIYVGVETDTVVGTEMLGRLDALRMLPVATFHISWTNETSSFKLHPASSQN